MAHKGISENTESKQLTISGFRVEVYCPYEEGDTLSMREAATLNQTRCENIRNNLSDELTKLAEQAKAAGVEPDLKAIQKLVTEYDTEYEFGAKRFGGRTTDPVEQEAMDFALERVREHYKSKGIPLKDNADKIRELAKGLLEKYPNIRADAEKRVKARQKSAEQNEFVIE